MALWATLSACASPTSTPDPCGAGAYAEPVYGQCVCEPGTFGDPEQECPPHADLCGEAEARVGHRVCEHTVEDDLQWTQLSIGGGPAIGGLRRMGKYMVPASPQSRLPTVFSDANSYRLHFCLMSAGFAPLFPDLSTADHAELILTRSGREFFAGAIYEFLSDDPVRYGFSIETAARPEEMLSADEVYRVYRHLADRFAPGELAYVPRGATQEATAAAWVDPPFLVLVPSDDDVAYEAYTPGIAYGRVRLSRVGEPADYGWQDIVVFEEVPVGWEGVFAGAITGQRQDVLSHLNVLSGQRGTPNAYVDDAIDALSPFEGQLVRIEADLDSYTLRAASEAEAQAFWQEHRPAIEVDNPAQYDYDGLDAFGSIATDTAEERALARARFGAKTVGLATLSRLLDPALQTRGLGVPFHYYDQFMRDNAWTVDLGQGPQSHSYAETIAAWLEDDEFRTDPALRRERLTALREQMRDHGLVSPELVDALHDRIVEEFGSDTVMVRVRSSSNAEDSPSFNGAGLYDSTSACAADSLPGADPDVSACDPTKSNRSLERGLAEVWASLWSQGAFEERDYYQLDHSAIAMGVTVSLRYEGELANGVAFTGDPVDPRDRRFVINAQAGEVDVVSPSPGISAELSRLTVMDGEVTQIDRTVASSLVGEGEVVMTDAHLRQLGAVMAELQTTYPIDHEAGSGPTPILDLEFKITRDDALVIKQIRTFVPRPYASDPTCLD